MKRSHHHLPRYKVQRFILLKTKRHQIPFWDTVAQAERKSVAEQVYNAWQRDHKTGTFRLIEARPEGFKPRIILP